MAEAVVANLSVVARGRDLVELSKPRITTMVVFTTALGLAVAPGRLGAARAMILLVATTGLVASANMLNCWLEREIDARMLRTRGRPIPAGRVDPWTAFAVGVVLGAFAVPALAVAVNPLTALLGTVAHAVYVLVYTPLKRVTPRALELGAVPGAIPPLMGWSAATGSLALPAWVLFGILFFWQLPHFIAIALYLEEDYRRAGLPVLPVARGSESAKRWLLSYSVALLAASLAASAIGMAGTLYLVAALGLGAVFVGFAIRGVLGGRGEWARRTMLYSLLYLVGVASALVVDVR